MTQNSIAVTPVEVDRIIVGERQRETDEDHVRRLVESLETLGVLLQPIILNESLVLIDGMHRLEMAKHLGWQHIDSRIVPNEAAETPEQRAFLEAEANVARKELTPSQRSILWSTIIKPRLVDQAQKRRVVGAGNGGRVTAEGSANFVEPLDTDRGSVNRLANQYVGMSAESLEKFDKVQAWAHDESLPTHVRAAAEKAIKHIDATGRVDGEYKTLERHVARELQGPVAPPAGSTEWKPVWDKVSKAVLDVEEILAELGDDKLATMLAEYPMAAAVWDRLIVSARTQLDVLTRVKPATPVQGNVTPIGRRA